MIKQNNLTILTPYFPSQSNKYGGIFIYDQVKEMSKSIDKLDVVVIRPIFYISRKFPFIKFNRKNSKFIDTGEKNIQVYELKYFPFPKDTIFYSKSISLSLFFYKILFSENILVHTIYPLGVAAENININSSVVLHGSDLRYFIQNQNQKNDIVKSLDNFKKIITVSDGLKNEVIDLGIKSEKVSTINNGLTIENKLQNRSIYPKKFRFVFVGSLIVPKGVYELLNSFIRLKQRYPDVELYFIGDGIEKQKLIENSSQEMNASIFFLGSLENNEVMHKLSEMDCLVLPSYKEGFGRVIIEMMSLGKPVVSTYSGGPEFIINKDNGLLVSPKNVDELKNAMSDMRKNYAKYEPNKIYQNVIENYDLEKQTKKLLNILYEGKI